ncbi:unnamed protein product [Adineta steineri]|uniref:Uncharacterized protein n=1 Tax=Adineta steineri TaxID=433720 RepID=A0A816E6A8_9BILA|nr:unnamed protein product [Adineta steineri]CAF1507549.1 unnamed protein product [Adineta steineri]CAF1545002.1 unnamed protein product [Adineta steineri]CAF1646348.1 unnamed protein product [Adineta steineri]CAF1658981.1 unnamed protein product [Adineta steineri]
MRSSTGNAICLRACKPLGINSCPCNPTKISKSICENSVKSSHKNGARFDNFPANFSVIFIGEGSFELKLVFG